MDANVLPCCGLIPEMVRGAWEPHAPDKPCRESRATLHFDGCCFGNPGIYGGAAVLDGPDGKHVVTTQGEGTNNEAEYWGLIMGLRQARDFGYTHVDVRGDSQLVIRQMTGEYSCRTDRMETLNQMARSAAKKLAAVTFTWIPREQNGEADKHSRDVARKHRDDLKTLGILRN